METIAVYWEDKIRTYGINLLEGLVLLHTALPAARIGEAGGRLPSQSSSENPFRLVWAQGESPDLFRIYMVCDKSHLIPSDSEVNYIFTSEGPVDPEPVDLICFQGPHYGDRYGILDFTLRALAPHRVPILGTVCAMATIYLVLPGGWGRRALHALNEAFEVPGAAAGKSKQDANGGLNS